MKLFFDTLLDSACRIIWKYQLKWPINLLQYMVWRWCASGCSSHQKELKFLQFCSLWDVLAFGAMRVSLFVSSCALSWLVWFVLWMWFHSSVTENMHSLTISCGCFFVLTAGVVPFSQAVSMELSSLHMGEVDVDRATHAINQRLSQITFHWISMLCYLFHPHFMFFEEKHLTNFWEWTFSSLRSSDCFTIFKLSLWAMVLHWT